MGHVAGMRDGMQNLFNVIREVIPAFPYTPEDRRKIIERADQIRQKSAAGNSRSSVGQIESTISTFYDDNRNMAVCWDVATWLSTVSLEGNPTPEQALNVARKTGAERGCK